MPSSSPRPRPSTLSYSRERRACRGSRAGGGGRGQRAEGSGQGRRGGGVSHPSGEEPRACHALWFSPFRADSKHSDPGRCPGAALGICAWVVERHVSLRKRVLPAYHYSMPALHEKKRSTTLIEEVRARRIALG